MIINALSVTVCHRYRGPYRGRSRSKKISGRLPRRRGFRGLYPGYPGYAAAACGAHDGRILIAWPRGGQVMRSTRSAATVLVTLLLVAACAAEPTTGAAPPSAGPHGSHSVAAPAASTPLRQGER